MRQIGFWGEASFFKNPILRLRSTFVSFGAVLAHQNANTHNVRDASVTGISGSTPNESLSSFLATRALARLCPRGGLMYQFQSMVRS